MSFAPVVDAVSGVAVVMAVLPAEVTRISPGRSEEVAEAVAVGFGAAGAAAGGSGAVEAADAGASLAVPYQPRPGAAG